MPAKGYVWVPGSYVELVKHNVKAVLHCCKKPSQVAEQRGSMCLAGAGTLEVRKDGMDVKIITEVSVKRKHLHFAYPVHSVLWRSGSTADARHARDVGCVVLLVVLLSCHMSMQSSMLERVLIGVLDRKASSYTQHVRWQSPSLNAARLRAEARSSMSTR